MDSLNIYLDKLGDICHKNKYYYYYVDLVTKFIKRNLTNKAQAREVLGYAELHHILPRCMCESQVQIRDNKNKVYLSAREHFVLHRLLTKLDFISVIFSKKMHYSLSCFSRNKEARKLTSRQHEIAKIAASISNKNRKLSDKTRSILSESRRGKGVFYDEFGNCHYINTDDPKIQELGFVGNQRSKTTVKDRNGITLQVCVDDPRIITGELRGIRAGCATYRDSVGNHYTLSTTDSRIKDMGLVHCNAGIKIKKRPGANVGGKNPMFGRIGEVCCFDTHELKFIRIPKTLFDSDTRYVGVNNKIARTYRNSKKEY